MLKHTAITTKIENMAVCFSILLSFAPWFKPLNTPLLRGSVFLRHFSHFAETFWSSDISVICLIVVLKLAVAMFISLYD